jgi:hypothetical protein
LTKLTTGEDYLVAGANIVLTTASNGSITISSIVGGADTQVQFNDGGTELGGSSNFTFNKNTNTLSVTNLSGSLTKLANGTDYLRGGIGILLVTGANGSVTITSTATNLTTWSSYTPTISATTTSPTLPTVHSIFGKYAVQGGLMTLMFSLSYESSAGAAAGDGTYKISLPPGFATTLAAGTAPKYADGSHVGMSALLADVAGSGGGWSVVPDSATTLVLVGQDLSSVSQPLAWGSSNFYIGQTANMRVSFIATIPVA